MEFAPSSPVHCVWSRFSSFLPKCESVSVRSKRKSKVGDLSLDVNDCFFVALQWFGDLSRMEEAPAEHKDHELRKVVLKMDGWIKRWMASVPSTHNTTSDSITHRIAHNLNDTIQNC